MEFNTDNWELGENLEHYTCIFKGEDLIAQFGGDETTKEEDDALALLCLVAPRLKGLLKVLTDDNATLREVEIAKADARAILKQLK
jgi:hypothetical protein